MIYQYLPPGKIALEMQISKQTREKMTTELMSGCAVGSFTTRTERIHHDTADETTRNTLEAHIFSFCCSQNLGSFYNGAGEIDCELHEPHQSPTSRPTNVVNLAYMTTLTTLA